LAGKKCDLFVDIPDDAYVEQVYRFAGSLASDSSLPGSSALRLAQFLSDRLSPKLTLVIEDDVAKMLDSWMSDTPYPRLALRSEVYWVLNGENGADAERIEEFLSIAYSHQLVGALVPQAVVPTPPQADLLDAEVEAIASEAVLGVVGCYDDTGYIYWTAKPPV